MKNKLENEFNELSEEFYKINKYKKMNNTLHHGLSRLDHIERVAKYSYRITKLFGLDYRSATRGAFLHDFFSDSDIDKSKFKKYLQEHPKIAYKNAQKFFKVNEVEKDVILKHMYPLTKEIPIYRESLIVCICDNVAGIYEFFRYQLKMSFTFIIIFIFNTLK